MKNTAKHSSESQHIMSGVLAAKDVESADPSTVRRRNHSARDPPVVSRPFAGRIGGNQGFTVSADDVDFDAVVAVNPDAAPLFTWSQSFNLRALSTKDLWKEATLEGVGTCLQVFLAGMYGVGLGPNGA